MLMRVCMGACAQALYKERRERLLAACRAYLAGTARVGGELPQAGGEGGGGAAEEGAETQQQTSQGFQLVLKGLLPKVEAALAAL